MSRPRAPLTVVAAALGLACGWPAPAAAQGGARVGVAQQSVLFLKVAETPAARRRETAIYEQIGLVLEDLNVIALVPGAPGFADLPLGRQVAIVRTMVGTSGPAAVTWTSEPVPGQLMAHLIVVQTGRMLVRTFETQATAGSEANIALAIRELLGTAYLFERPPPGPGGVRALTESVRRAATAGAGPSSAPAAPAAVAPVRPPRAPYGLILLGTGEASLAGYTGSQRRAGGALAAERAVGARAWLGLSLGASWGPVETTPALALAALHLEAGATLRWAWRRGPFTLGPRVVMAARWSRWEARPAGQGRQELATWIPRMTLGPEVQLRLTGAVALVLWPSLAATPQHEHFVRASDGATVTRTGWLDLGIALGLRLGGAAP